MGTRNAKVASASNGSPAHPEAFAFAGEVPANKGLFNGIDKCPVNCRSGRRKIARSTLSDGWNRSPDTLCQVRF